MPLHIPIGKKPRSPQQGHDEAMQLVMPSDIINHLLQDSRFPPSTRHPDSLVEPFLSQIKYQHSAQVIRQQAKYIHSTKTIIMRYREIHEPHHYMTLYHELIHHACHIHRIRSVGPADELIAEIGATILMHIAGIPLGRLAEHAICQHAINGKWMTRKFALEMYERSALAVEWILNQEGKSK